MKIDLIATTNSKQFMSKEEFDIFSGHTAGVCYMPSSFDGLLNEDIEKTKKRVNQTKNSGHHSVYDHEYVSLYIEDIPKILAMIINNEKMYTTSEKSARYTKMVLKEDEQRLYDKWLEKFNKAIKDKYGNQPAFFTETKINKLAQENARYLTSVFTPTSMVYTCSYRQLNILYSLLQKFLNKRNNNTVVEMLKPEIENLCSALEKLPYLDEKLQTNEKNRELSLFNTKGQIEQYFGDVYATSYKGSYAQLAQAQRHRTLSYNINLLNTKEFYVPPILLTSPQLVEEWIADCNKLAINVPQGQLIQINEMGTMDNFILKMKERKCTFAQKEINDQTNLILKTYLRALQEKNHARADELERYTYGSRCTFPDYTCTAPCGFKDGINETRKI